MEFLVGDTARQRSQERPSASGADLPACGEGRNAALTDYGKPIAVIAPLVRPPEERDSPDGSNFRLALLSIPNGFDVDF